MTKERISYKYEQMREKFFLEKKTKNVYIEVTFSFFFVRAIVLSTLVWSVWDKTNIMAINKQKVNHCHHLVSSLIPKLNTHTNTRKEDDKKTRIFSGSNFISAENDKKILVSLHLFSPFVCVCVYSSTIHVPIFLPFLSSYFYDYLLLHNFL